MVRDCGGGLRLQDSRGLPRMQKNRRILAVNLLKKRRLAWGSARLARVTRCNRQRLDHRWSFEFRTVSRRPQPVELLGGREVVSLGAVLHTLHCLRKSDVSHARLTAVKRYLMRTRRDAEIRIARFFFQHFHLYGGVCATSTQPAQPVQLLASNLPRSSNRKRSVAVASDLLDTFSGNFMHWIFFESCTKGS